MPHTLEVLSGSDHRARSTPPRAAAVIPPPMDPSGPAAVRLQIPRRTAREIYGLKLDPADAFFLSNVDDQLSIEELADVVGFDLAKALRSTEALVNAGAVELGPPRGTPTSGRRVVAPDTSESKTAAGRRRPSRAPTPPKSGPAPPAGPPTPAPAEDTICDLDAETLARIDAALLIVASRTHYGILGLPRGASNKEVRRAYHALAGTLHPDRYFRKKLGAYKKTLSAAFEKITASYELLRVEKTRFEYDARLVASGEPEEVAIALAPAVTTPDASATKRRSMRPTKAPPKAPTKAPKGRASVSALKIPTIPPAKAPMITSVVTPAPTESVSRPSKAPKPRTSTPKMPAIPRAAAPAAPIGRAAATPAPAPVPAAKAKPEATSKSAPLLASAQKALIQGDATAAANLYRLALQFAEDPAARRYAESGMNEARSILADGYTKTARKEEKASNWGAAVAAYAKAVDLRPQDGALCERLANALREEGTDLPRALRFAEQAIARAPRRASYLKTLGCILMQTGQRKDALERLEAAFTLEPDDATAQLIARLRKR